ncbi:methyltransferase N6AMT1 isoform X4 [Myxocyprinus asiaticus]|uniref:methyltransferase N6AMT1 isoform X4 n=1 Tax=Myxocyprinus asiaticus TaxID=70543 RepID=UPI00222260E2|nr:methyltransferase N6AMT1 isoform X4 [Myxocyprinus asiaticus]
MRCSCDALMFPTPLYSHAGRGCFSDVYEPAEDSFLLIDALEKDAERLKQSSCTDVNPAASQCTQETSHCNSLQLQPLVTDLVECLLPRLNGKVDVLVFNPPYVVTPSEEVGSHGIEASWAGGKRGREVMDRFFPIIPQLLSVHGLFYLVTVSENNPKEILSLLRESGLKGDACLSRQAGRERLSILRFSKQ